ncbi:Lrp/AsnC family transcriptional regulator [bacterium]|nr:Lrp/AsnC family transcriptional regulator [bacterium]MDB4438018.1 Lrp/AsnC family transcriptional regulator [bacterium]
MNNLAPVTDISEPTEPINKKILSVSEDLLNGFHIAPFDAIAGQCGQNLEVVLERIRLMLQSGTIRRVRQTLLATKLAEGALAAWQIPKDNLTAAFRLMADEDPFSGHIVVRSTDRELPGSQFNLWTTLKVPQGESLQEHAEALKGLVGAKQFRLMPAQGVFALGVGHMRRRGLEPGALTPDKARMMTTTNVTLTEEEWTVLLAIKRDLTEEEIVPRPWVARAAKIGMDLEKFYRIARQLDSKRVIGRFSTFLEHVKPSASGEKVTRYNGLFHWAVPKGMEKEAGAEIGRHYCMTHCYWREGGPDFGNVNIMGVVHGTQKETVLAHKAAIDAHLEKVGIPLLYTSVFWGGQSEITPSEISPVIYRDWHKAHQA